MRLLISYSFASIFHCIDVGDEYICVSFFLLLFMLETEIILVRKTLPKFNTTRMTNEHEIDFSYFNAQ